MPSLKPNRLRGVAWARTVDDVRPKPSCDQRTRHHAEADPGQVADGVHGDLRVVGAGLDAQVAAGCAGSSASPGKRGRSAARPGARAARPNRSCRRVGTASGRSRRSASGRTAGRPSASPVSSGGASGRPPTRADRAGLLARRHPPRPRRSSPAAARPARPASSVVTSKATKCSRSCGGVTMPAWCAPWKGDRDRRRGRVRGRRRPSSSERRGRRRPPPTAAAPAAPQAEQPPAASHAAVAHGACRRPTSSAMPRGDLADRLGQRVDRVATAPCSSVLRQLVVELPAVALAGACASAALGRGELLVELVARPGVALVQHRPQRPRRRLCEPSRLASKSHRSVCE